MVLFYSLAFAIYLGYTLYHQNAQQYLLVSLSISIIYYVQENLHQKGQSLMKIFRGELPSHLLFLAWLYYFKAPYFLHYIPLILSNTGKVYRMLNEKTIQQATVIQQLVVFQTQCEAFITFSLFISALSFVPAKMLQFLSYVSIVKIKYRFYAPTHKGYNQMHFFFDRISRNFRFRSFYHLIYQVVSCLSNDVYSPPLIWQVLY